MPASHSESVADLYASVEEIIENIPDHLQQWGTNYYKSQRHRLQRDIGVVEGFEPDGHLLEIGGAPFLISAAIKRMGRTLTTLDAAPERFAALIEKEGLDVRACDVEQQDFPVEDHSIDYVLFCEVFEHLRIHPLETLRKIKKALKPGGTMLLSTPNLYGYPAMKRYLLGQGSTTNSPVYEFSKLDEIGHMGHIREYAPNEIRLFLQNAGFEVTDFEYRWMNPPSWKRRLMYRCLPFSHPFMAFQAKPADS